jgi:hypothetical protein
MSENWAIAIIGIFVTILNLLILMIVSGIKADIKDLWARVYNHRHEVNCNSDECHALRTGNVIVPGGETK